MSKALSRSSYLEKNVGDFPAEFEIAGVRYEKADDLRYGTNPHQPAAYYRPAGVSGWKPQCDGTWINPYAPCVVFGPQPPGTHSANERITLNEILECAKVFASMAMDYCK
jgi:acetylornithine deacetylase/succinyl-diaminopimelate desuccinylase-like protein